MCPTLALCVICEPIAELRLNGKLITHPSVPSGDDWGAFDEDDWRGKSRAGAVIAGDSGGEGQEDILFRPREGGGPGIAEDDVPGLLGGARFGKLGKAEVVDDGVSGEEEGVSDEAARSAGR